MGNTAPPPIPDITSFFPSVVIDALGQPLGTIFLVFASAYVGAAAGFFGARFKLSSIWSRNALWRQDLYFFILPSNPMPARNLTTTGAGGVKRLATTSDASIFFPLDPQTIRTLNENCLRLTSRGVFYEIFTNRMVKYVWLITGLVLQTMVFLLTLVVLASAHEQTGAELPTIAKAVAFWPFVYTVFVWLLVHIVQDWVSAVATANRSFMDLDQAPYEVVKLK